MILVKNCNLNGIITNLLIINDKIIKIGKIDKEAISWLLSSCELEELDAKNNPILPSYIDTHVHITGGGGEQGFSSKVEEIKLSDITKNGVTTLVGVLGTDTITRSIENLVSKTKALNEEGITAFCLTGGYEFPSPTITGRVQKDIAFISEIIGVKIAISDHRCYNPNKDDLIKLMSEVRVASLISNKPGIINYHMGWGKGNMDILLEILNETNIPAKHIRPTHISNNEKVYEQSLEICKLGGFIDITAGQDVDKISYYVDKTIKNGYLSNLTVSSDSNGSCPIWFNNECIGMSASDMSGLHMLVKKLVIDYNYDINEAIKLLTCNPAKALNLNSKGTINEGFDADLLILDDDLNINTVISKGKTMVRDKKIIKRGVYEK